MTTNSLPSALVWLARLVIPARHVPHVLADLADDYSDAQRRRSAAGARWWLAREAGDRRP